MKHQKKREKKLLKQSEELINELVIELRSYLFNQKKKQQLHNIQEQKRQASNILKPKPMYSGVGSIQTSCQACQRRRFG